MAFSFKNLINLIIPEYLIITIFSTFSSFLIINQTLSSVFYLVPAMVSLSFAMLGFNVLNMIIDYKLDLINKPLRPLPAGKISLKEAKITMIIFYALSVFFAFFTNLAFLYVLFLYILISFLYTSPKIYLKKYIWSSPLIGGTIYGAIPFLTAWSFSSKDFPLIFFLFFSILIAIIAPIKDIEDVKGEKIYRIRSIPSKFGKRNTLYFSQIFIFLLLFSIFSFSLFRIIEQKFIYSSIISIISLILINRKYNIKSENQIFTQSKIVTVNMVIVVIIQLIFGLTNIFL